MPAARRLTVALFVLLAWGAGGAATVNGPGSSDEKNEIRLPGTRIELSYVGDTVGLDRDEVRDWIMASAQAVQGYYGHFPVRHVRIRIEAGEGKGALGNDVRPQRRADSRRGWPFQRQR